MFSKLIPPSKKQRLSSPSQRLVSFGDVQFPAVVSGANYDGEWNPTMTAAELYSILLTDESAILFCARNGWIESRAPICVKESCTSKANTTGYLYKRKGGVWTWRLRCCKSTKSLFSESMFFQSHYGPAKVLELMFYMASRVPLTTSSFMIFGRLSRECQT